MLLTLLLLLLLALLLHLLLNLLLRYGLWSRKVFSKAVDWYNHLKRYRNRESWAAQVPAWHDSSWLLGMRASLPGGSLVASATCTRAAPGGRRWEDGVSFARGQI